MKTMTTNNAAASAEPFDGFHGDAGLRPAIAAFGGSSDIGFGIEGPGMGRSRYFRGRYGTELAGRTVIVQIADPAYRRPDIRIRVRDFDAERVAAELADIGCVTNQATPEEEKRAAAVRASFADPARRALFCHRLSSAPVALADLEAAIRTAERKRAAADRALAAVQNPGASSAMLADEAFAAEQAAAGAEAQVVAERERFLASIAR